MEREAETHTEVKRHREGAERARENHRKTEKDRKNRKGSGRRENHRASQSHGVKCRDRARKGKGRVQGVRGPE